tara:strand:+ start:231 stop:1577 length:1347 start_codon:yes stop_codon:yes gene_type:complete
MKRHFCLFLALAAYASAEPEDFDRLTFHSAPEPLNHEAVTSDWPRFLGPNHNLHSPETQLLKDWPESGPTPIWEVERGSGHAPAVVKGDYVVLFHELNSRELVECLHPETGKRHWKFDYPVTLGSSYGQQDAPRAPAVIDGDLTFSVGLRGDLHCFHLQTGEVVWKKNLNEEYGDAPFFFGRGSSPLVLGEHLILNTGGRACVVALDKKTGKEVWATPHQWQASYASPVPATIHGKKRVMVLTGGMTNPPSGGLLSLDPANGKIDGAFPWRASMFASVNAASPVVVGNGVFITESYTEGGGLIRFPPTGKAELVWKAPRFGSQITTPVLHEGHLYGFDGSSASGTELVCYEAESGREVWRDGLAIEIGASRALPGRGSLLRADGAFLCLGAQGSLLWLDLSPKGVTILSKAQLFRAPETWGAPALSRGLLFVNQNALGSRLIAYDLRK